MKINSKHLALSSVIAALYTIITLFLTYPMSYQASQFRVAEALTILPFFSSASILGLFLGCILTNILSPYGILDLIFGSLSTLIAAIITHFIGRSNLKFKKYIAPLPPIITNMFIIGFLLHYTMNWPLFITILQVGLGETLCCYGLGLPLLLFIERNKELQKLFLNSKFNKS